MTAAIAFGDLGAEIARVTVIGIAAGDEDASSEVVFDSLLGLLDGPGSGSPPCGLTTKSRRRNVRGKF